MISTAKRIRACLCLSVEDIIETPQLLFFDQKCDMSFTINEAEFTNYADEKTP